MKMKLTSLSAVVAVFAGLAAGQVQAERDPLVVQETARAFGISEEQAEHRLAYEESVAPVIEESLKATLGDRFGGAWMNKEGTQLVVGVTNDADAAVVRAAGAEPVRVTWSYAQLRQVQALLDSRIEELQGDIFSTGVDVLTNSVVVVAADSPTAWASVARLTEGVDPSAIRVETSQERPQTFYELVGGQAYYINGSSRCSIGFAVTAPGFVTAGHCGRAGYTTTGYNGVSQGTFQGSSFPSNDYAWVRTNSSWTPTNKIAGTTTRITGSTVAAVGSSVCRSGSTTGLRCGSIQATNQTVCYSQGCVYGLTKTSVCAEPGDSGGPYFSSSQAQGVCSGGSGNCSTGGTTYFQPVREILSVYGLTLRTF